MVKILFFLLIQLVITKHLRNNQGLNCKWDHDNVIFLIPNESDDFDAIFLTILKH